MTCSPRRSTSWPVTRFWFATAVSTPWNSYPNSTRATAGMPTPFSPRSSVGKRHGRPHSGTRDASSRRPYTVAWQTTSSRARRTQQRTMIVDGAGSELERVDLRDAELDGLDIPRWFRAFQPGPGPPHQRQLGGATLSDALLRGTDLSGADLRGANLTRADLDSAILLGAGPDGAELGDASLRGVIADNTATWPAGFTPPNGGVTRDGDRAGMRNSTHENGVLASQDPHGANRHIMLRRTVDSRHAGRRHTDRPVRELRRGSANQQNKRTDQQLSGAVPVYAGPDQDVCGVDM